MTFAKPLPSNRDYAVGLARAFGGAVIFGLPLLMTMEMWSLGTFINPVRLALFVASNFIVLVVLSRFGGFEPTSTLSEDVLDALGAYAVGILTSASILGLFGILSSKMPLTEFSGMIAMQSIPASFGAMLARKQLGSGESQKSEDQQTRSDGYAAQLFLMLAGALFLAFNVAPTEEVILIGFKMTPLHSLALIGASLLILHAFVFTVGFPGQEQPPEGYGPLRLFATYTLAGYGIAILASTYILWTFGRLDGSALQVIAGSLTVLGFPASVGAAIARLVV